MLSDNREDTLSAKRDNKGRAMDVVRQALLSYNQEKKHPIYGGREINKYQDIVVNEWDNKNSEVFKSKDFNNYFSNNENDELAKNIVNFNCRVNNCFS